MRVVNEPSSDVTATLRIRLWLLCRSECRGRHLSNEKPDRRSGQSGKEHSLEGGRSAGSLGVNFDKVKASSRA
jgi:hypothetical protein